MTAVCRVPPKGHLTRLQFIPRPVGLVFRWTAVFASIVAAVLLFSLAATWTVRDSQDRLLNQCQAVKDLSFATTYAAAFSYFVGSLEESGDQTGPVPEQSAVTALLQHCLLKVDRGRLAQSFHHSLFSSEESRAAFEALSVRDNCEQLRDSCFPCTGEWSTVVWRSGLFAQQSNAGTLFRQLLEPFQHDWPLEQQLSVFRDRRETLQEHSRLRSLAFQFAHQGDSAARELPRRADDGSRGQRLCPRGAVGCSARVQDSRGVGGVCRVREAMVGSAVSRSSRSTRCGTPGSSG